MDNKGILTCYVYTTGVMQIINRSLRIKENNQNHIPGFGSFIIYLFILNNQLTQVD